MNNLKFVFQNTSWISYFGRYF